MHEARENAAQTAWRYCQERPVLDLDAFRELVRLIEPILAEGWQRAMASPAIVNPDVWPDFPADGADLPGVQTVALDHAVIDPGPDSPPPPPRAEQQTAAPVKPSRPPRHSQQELDRIRFEEW